MLSDSASGSPGKAPKFGLTMPQWLTVIVVAFAAGVIGGLVGGANVTVNNFGNAETAPAAESMAIDGK